MRVTELRPITGITLRRLACRTFGGREQLAWLGFCSCGWEGVLHSALSAEPEGAAHADVAAHLLAEH